MGFVLRWVHTRAVAIEQAFAAGERAGPLPAHGVSAARRTAGAAVSGVRRNVDARAAASREARGTADVAGARNTGSGAVLRRGTREIARTAVGGVTSNVETTSPAEREPRLARQGALAVAYGRGVQSTVTRGTAPAAMHRIARYVDTRPVAVRRPHGTVRGAAALNAHEPLGASIAAPAAVSGTRSRIHARVAAACVTLVARQAADAVRAQCLAVSGYVTGDSAGTTVLGRAVQVHAHRAAQRKALGAFDLTHTVGTNRATSRGRRAGVAARATVERGRSELDTGPAAVR